MAAHNVTRGYGILEGYLARKRVKMANKLIPSAHRKGRILDIGCGSYPLFLMNTEFSEKYAIDKNMINNEQELMFSNIKFVDYDIDKGKGIPFDNDYFDIVSMLAVFEHIEPELLPVILTETYRILRNGGIYIMTTPSSWTHGLLKLMGKLNMVSHVEIAEHKGAYSLSTISSMLQDASFREDKIMSGYFEMFMNTWTIANK